MAPRWSVRGFTLIELLVALTVAAVLLTIVVPSFTDQLARRKLEGAATELSTDLQFARSQAVAKNTTATLATNAGGNQYTLTAASSTFKTVTLDSQLSITPSTTITYDQLRAMATASGAMTVSSTKTSGQLQVVVSPMGRVSMCSPAGGLKGYTAC
jgi:type IV fimbrial biogenesis protein FimT